MSGTHEGWLQVRMVTFANVFVLSRSREVSGADNGISLCPITNRLVSVVWKPVGADKFCSRHAWVRK
jgi:hypothetical protein